MLNNTIGGRETVATPHEGDHAERTPIVTAILDFEVGPSAISTRVLYWRRQEMILGEDVAHPDFAVIGDFGRRTDNIGNLNLMRITYYPGDAG